MCCYLCGECPLQTCPITQPQVRYIQTARRTHGDGVYHASITSRDKKYIKFEFNRHIEQKSSGMSYHPSATKVTCEELRTHNSRKGWTRLLRVLLASQCPLQMNPISQPRVAGTLHPHSSATCFVYVTLRSPIPIPRKPLPVGLPNPPNKNQYNPPVHPTHHPNSIIGVHALKFYC